MPENQDPGSPSPGASAAGTDYDQLTPAQQDRVAELVNTGMSLVLAIIQAVRESQGGGGSIPVSHQFDTSNLPVVPPWAWAAGIGLVALLLVRR